MESERELADESVRRHAGDKPNECLVPFRLQWIGRDVPDLPEKAYFISDGRYETQSKQQVTGMEILIGVEPYPEIIKKEKLISDGMHLAFEAEHVSVSSAKKAGRSFPQLFLGADDQCNRADRHGEGQE